MDDPTNPPAAISPISSRRRALKLSWELKDSVEPKDWKDFKRASGEVSCEGCGKPLYSHWQPLELTCPTMVADCYGRWWKL